MRLFGIFAKQPVPGTVKTRLALDIGPQAAAELCDAFLRDLTARFAATAERRWLGYAPDAPEAREWFAKLAAGRFELWPQPAGDLGSRMEEFFAAAILAGATHVVLIGSDSPTLPAELVQQAFAALQSHDAVLGPAQDGGYYLIGLKKVWLGMLHGVRWSTPHALADTLLRLRCAELDATILPTWIDIDTAGDVKRLELQLREQPPSAPSATAAWLARHPQKP